jgi:hypothetical protein
LDIHLIIKTDQQSLKFMMSQRLTTGIQHKLLMKLREFNYSIEYKKGKENMAAYALSRQDHSSLAISFGIPAWVADIEANYINVTQYVDLILQLPVNSQAIPHYSVHIGILRYKGKICIGSATDLKARIMSSLHSSAIGGHSVIKATYQRIKRIFHWPHLKKEVKTFVAECVVCQHAKAEHCHYPGLLAPLPIPTMAWTFISMDFIEGMPKSRNKNVILVVVVRLTKYGHFIALSHPYTANTVAQLFIDNVFKLHGPPVAIVALHYISMNFYKPSFAAHLQITESCLAI